MIRFLARMALNVLSNAVGLVAASLILDGFEISGSAFVVALLVYSVTEALLGPWVAAMALKSVPALRGGIALATTFVALFVTTLLSDGLSISGIDTWALAVFIVWIFSVVGSLLLPLVLFKKILSDDKETQSEA